MAARTTSPTLHNLEHVGMLGSSRLRHNGGIRAVASAAGLIVSAGDGAIAHVWNAATGELIRDLEGAERGLYSVALSRDGRTVIAGGSELAIWNVKSGRHRRVTVKPLVMACALSADGKTALFGNDRKPERVDVETGEFLAPLKGHQARVDAVAFSLDGRLALSGGGDHKIKLHDLTTTKPSVRHTFEGYSKACGFTPDSQFAWSIGWDHATLWSVESGVVVRTFTAGRTGAMDPLGRTLAVLTDTDVRLFDVVSGEPRGTISYVNGDTVCFSDDGAQLIVGSDGRGMGEGFALSVFDVATGSLVMPRDDGHAAAVEAIAIPADAPAMLLSLGADRMLQLNDLPNLRCLERFGPVDGEGKALAVTRDGLSAATTTDTSQVLLWNLKEGSSRALPVVSRGRSSMGVSFAPDEKELAWAPYLPPVPVLIDVASGKTRLQFEGHKGQLCAVTFSLDGKLVLSSSADECVIGWNRSDGLRQFTLECSGFINAMSTVPASDLLVTGTTSGQLLVWNLTTRAHQVLQDVGREVHAIVGLPGRRAVVLRKADDWECSVIEVWSLETAKVEASADLTSMALGARSLAVTPDGATICAGLNTGQVMVLRRTLTAAAAR